MEFRGQIAASDWCPADAALLMSFANASSSSSSIENVNVLNLHEINGKDNTKTIKMINFSTFSSLFVAIVFARQLFVVEMREIKFFLLFCSFVETKRDCLLFSGREMDANKN